MRALADRILFEFATGVATGFATGASEYATGGVGMPLGTVVCHWGRWHASGLQCRACATKRKPAKRESSRDLQRAPRTPQRAPRWRVPCSNWALRPTMPYSVPQLHTPCPSGILRAPVAYSASEWQTQWQTPVANLSGNNFSIGVPFGTAHRGATVANSNCQPHFK